MTSKEAKTPNLASISNKIEDVTKTLVKETIFSTKEVREGGFKIGKQIFSWMGKM